MRKLDAKGVGGFAEELPALLVVLIAISLFVASAAQAYASWGSRQSFLRDRERVEAFAGMISADGSLLWQGRLGMFDATWLSDANASDDFRSRYPAAAMGFEYRMTVVDLSTDARWSFNSSEPPPAGDKVRVSSACNIVEPDGFVRPAMLWVEAWGVSK